MIEFVDELSRTFRFADIVDIVIVAIVIYLALSWARERAVRSIVLPVIAIIGVYWIARWLELYLTTMMFQYGFLAAVFTLVLVFQEDIRRGFERVASWQWPRTTNEASANVAIDTLVESVTQLARLKIGALLVFPGREPIDHHVRGGVLVNADISLPLLCSIFHPESPGHDGAVTIDRNRVLQLGVHLPLSRKLSQVPHGGTRHTAALGLAERCDALVVAVSEERGSITLARNGQLTEVTAEQFVEELQQYYQGQPSQEDGDGKGRLQSASRKVLSLVLASILWFTLAHQTETVQRTLVVPIEFRELAEQLIVESSEPTLAEVTLRGSEQAFTSLDAKKVAVSLDLANRSVGRHALPTSLATLKNLPKDLNVVRVAPDQIQVTIQPSKPPVSDDAPDVVER